MPPGYFDPPPTDEEIDRQMAVASQRMREKIAADPDWTPF
jgi:hypothetical protein